MSQTTVYTSHKIFNIYKYLDWQGRDIYLFVWWHPGEARGLWFPWWGQQPSFCHRFDRAELVCWSIGTTWQIKQCFIVLWMKHIPHHDIDAAREWSDQCLQPPWASLNTTPLLTTAQYHTTAEQWLLLRRWWSSRGSGWQWFKDFLFTIAPIW